MLARREQGVALISVLLVVAIATIVCTMMLSQQQGAISRTTTLLSSEQAWQYNLGAEAFAMEVLAEDARNDAASSRGNVDNLGEIWARPWPPFPVDGGMIKGSIEDEQGRFNLNSLVASGTQNAFAVAVFQRLLAQLQLSPGIANAVVDWIDIDNDPSGYEGAESDWYMRQKPPYRAANQAFSSVSELRLIRGIDEKAYQALEPLVTALPTEAVLNINTAKMPVLASLAPGLTSAQLAAMRAAAGADGFLTVDSFIQSPELTALSQSDKDSLRALISVSSQYFRISSEADIDNQRSTLISWVRRRSSDDLVIFRREKVLPIKDSAMTTDNNKTTIPDLNAMGGKS